MRNSDTVPHHNITPANNVQLWSRSLNLGTYFFAVLLSFVISKEILDRMKIWNSALVLKNSWTISPCLLDIIKEYLTLHRGHLQSFDRSPLGQKALESGVVIFLFCSSSSLHTDVSSPVEGFFSLFWREKYIKFKIEFQYFNIFKLLKLKKIY